MSWIGSRRFRQVERILWAAVLVALPVTSFHYMPLMGDAQVKPLAFLPALLLLGMLVLRCAWERRLIFWSSSLQPVLVFLLVALIATAAGFYLAPPNLYANTYVGRSLRAWVSLGVGLVFLVDAIVLNRDELDLVFSIRWIYVGFVADVLWSLLQIFTSVKVVNAFFPAGRLMESLQRALTGTGMPPNHRISGLNLEPSWLAAQILTLYLPWAIAAVIKRYDWSRRRWIVYAILTGCVFILLFTYSRSGILTAVGAVTLTFLIAGWDWVRRAWGWMLAPFRRKMEASKRSILAICLRIAVIAAILAGMTGGITILSRNSYFASLWQARKTGLVSYMVNIYAGPRLAYAWAGWTIFSGHPLTGVGLGAAGFSIQKNLPDWAHFNISEVAQLISPDNSLYPNVKDLYIRLLSETGIVGFWAFFAFYLLSLGKILRLLRSKEKYLAFLGTASLLAWLGIVILGISQDSLAMPDIWLPLGMLIGITDYLK